MKAILLKPIDGLEVGQTYKVAEDSHWLTNEGKPELYIIDPSNPSEYLANMSLATLLDGTWFILQVLPEQLKTQIEQAITNAHFNSVIAGPKEYAEAVSAVISGEEQ